MTPLRRLLGDRRGVAAVEMALIAPVLAGLVALSFETWRYATRIQEMKDAVKAGAQYYMNGGKEETDARTIALGAWTHAPAGANISAARDCVCGATVHVCTTLCSNATVPEMRITLSATGTWNDSYFAKNISTTQVVRVR